MNDPNESMYCYGNCNAATVAQCSAYILPLFPLLFEMKAIMK